MNDDEIKNIARKIERTVCPGCLRRRDERLCITCPVAELVDMCKADKHVWRTLISEQMFEYLYDIGVVTFKRDIPGYDGIAFDLVKYPEGMKQCSLLDGNMKEDLLNDVPWSIRFDTVSHNSPDTKTQWAIPDWLFMDSQKDVLKAYFGRTK